MLSKYPLLNRNKISTNKNNKNKTLKINTTFFERNFDQKYLNMSKGDYLLIKIEKELNALLNKQKMIKLKVIKILIKINIINHFIH